MKKILSVVIAISMLLGMMIPMGITASAAVATECATWAEVVAAVEADSAASIKLTADVTADSTIASFAGTFDGNGKTVTVSNSLFTALADGATIKNLTVASASAISATPLAGTASGNVTISDITVDADASINVSGSAFIGKIDAAATVALTDCVNNADISGTANMAGFIGQISAAATVNFTNCVNNGAITTTGSHGAGFIACIDPAGAANVTFEGCANNGKIFGNKTGKCEVSGFVTYLEATEASTITFKNCVSAGALENLSESGTKYSASGFMARAKKTATVSMENCLSIVPSFAFATQGSGAFFWSVNETTATVSFTASNSYYLANEKVTALTDTETAAGGITAVTADQLASGEVAYKLGEAWGQTLDTDAETAPVIGGEPVYQYPDGRYSNIPWGQGGTDEPEIGESSVILEVVNDVLTATIEGPTTLKVGDTANIVVTYTITKENHLINAYGIGFTPDNTDIVDFTENATFALSGHDDDFEDFTHTYGDAKYISQSVTKGRGALQVVVTFTITAKAAGSTAINFYDNPDLKLFAYTSTDLTYEQFEPLNYTITVVDENADEPIVVDTFNVEGYVAPTVGASLADALANLFVPTGAPYSIIDAYWFNDISDDYATEEDFIVGYSYSLGVEIKLADGYVLADEYTIQFNGDASLCDPLYILEGNENTDYDLRFFSVSTTLPAEGGEGGDEPTDNVVTNVNVNGYVAPTVGANLADALANLSVPAGAPYSIVDAYWFNDATLEIATEETFAEGGMYCLYVRFVLADGYTLDIENCVYALNGDTTLVLFGSPNYDETVDCDFLLCSITTELGGGEGGEEGGDEPTTPDGTEENPFVIQNKDDVAAILVPAGETYYFIIDPFNYYDTVGEDFIGNLIKVIGAGATINGNATLDLPTNGRMGWPVLFSITAGTEDARAEIVVPKGTFSNPDSFDADGKAEVSLTSPKNDFEPYMFIFKADKNGILVVTAPDGTVVTINNLTSYSYGDMGVNTAEVVAGDEIQILIGTEGANAAGTVSVTIVPHLNIAVWTKNGDWVSADELAAMKADFIAYLEKEFDIDTNVLGIEWVELTTDGNKVADLGALVNAGNFDIIVGCGNNVDSTAGVTIVKKGDINTDYVAAGRKVALLDENNALAAYLYDLLTALPAVEIDKVDVSGYVDPVYGQTVADYMETFVPKLPDGANYSIHAIYFFEIDPETMEMIGELLADDYVFDSSKTYAVSIIFEANDGYVFASNAVITVNGGDVELLETAAEGNRAGAAIAFAPAASVEIDKIDVSGITAPEHGKTVGDYKASFVPKLPEGANYSVVAIFWFELDPETMEGNGVLADDYVFDSSKTYGFGLGIEANDGYTFADGAVITANGGALELYASMAEGPEAALALVFNPAPATGDNSTIAIFAIAAVATIGCVAIALRKKKED